MAPAMSGDSRDQKRRNDRVKSVLGILVCAQVLCVAGCRQLANRKPGDESVSVPIEGQEAVPSNKETPKEAKSAALSGSKPDGKSGPASTRKDGGASAKTDKPAFATTPRVDSPGEARALSRAFSAVAHALGPSVVRLDVEVASGGRNAGDEGEGGDESSPDELPPPLRRLMPFGQRTEPPPPERGTGSGVIWDGSGNIVTNRHVVDKASKVNVVFPDGREFAADVVGTDSQTDVAVVRLQKIPPGLIAARVGDSDALEVGEWVLAVGSPLGLDQTVTVGIVSGKGRVGRNVQMSGERVRQYIQTDAKINPGNSGGPLVNLSAEVVGINTLINTGPGGAYGFAIPMNQVKRVVEALLKDGRVRYPYLGVMVGDVKDLDPAGRVAQEKSANAATKSAIKMPTNGAVISEMSPGSPATHAGLRAGDIIVQIDGKTMEGAGDVIDYVSARAIGSKVVVGYWREGKLATAEVVLGELPDLNAKEPNPVLARYGISLQSLTQRLAESLGLPPSQKGAVVVEIEPGGVADRAGITEGDVIVAVDRKSVTGAEAVITALSQSRKSGHLLKLRGPNGARFVTLDAGRIRN